jgi:prevent-host-death family protein
MSTFSLYEAKTRLSALVDQAAAGEEIVISKNGVPKAKLVPIPQAGQRRMPNNSLGVTYIADDFDAVDQEIIDMFEGKYSNDPAP